MDSDWISKQLALDERAIFSDLIELVHINVHIMNGSSYRTSKFIIHPQVTPMRRYGIEVTEVTVQKERRKIL